MLPTVLSNYGAWRLDAQNTAVQRVLPSWCEAFGILERTKSMMLAMSVWHHPITLPPHLRQSRDESTAWSTLSSVRKATLPVLLLTFNTPPLGYTTDFEQ